MFESLEKFDIYRSVIEIPNYMIEKIYELKEYDKGTPKTNYGGWHSKTFTPYKDYYNGKYKWTAEFIETVLSIVNTKWPNTSFNRAWFNLAHKGGTNRWHDHGTHPIVGVIYIQVPPNSSAIEFEKDIENFVYNPKEGEFLIFPGHLRHRVLSHSSSIDRISMAINFD